MSGTKYAWMSRPEPGQVIHVWARPPASEPERPRDYLGLWMVREAGWGPQGDEFTAQEFDLGAQEERFTAQGYDWGSLDYDGTEIGYPTGLEQEEDQPS